MYCTDKPYPCGGILLAMRGYDGKELWRIPTFAEIFALNCGHLDINKDGFPDCIAAGRMGTLFAFEPRNGKAFLHVILRHLAFSVYRAHFLK